MRNWRTSLIGCLYAAITVVYQAYQTTQGQEINWAQVGIAAALAVVSILAKDAGVTGTEK